MAEDSKRLLAPLSVVIDQIIRDLIRPALQHVYLHVYKLTHPDRVNWNEQGLITVDSSSPDPDQSQLPSSTSPDKNSTLFRFTEESCFDGSGQLFKFKSWKRHFLAGSHGQFDTTFLCNLLLHSTVKNITAGFKPLHKDSFSSRAALQTLLDIRNAHAHATDLSIEVYPQTISNLRKCFSRLFGQPGVENLNQILKGAPVVQQPLESLPGPTAVAEMPPPEAQMMSNLRPYIMSCNQLLQHHSSRFHPGTRQEFVSQVDRWLSYLPGRASPEPAPAPAAAAAAAAAATASATPPDNITSRVFVIFGGPGEGKSALFAHLCKNFSADVAAIHACRFSIQDTINPRRIVLWIVYQLASNFEWYRAKLLDFWCVDDLRDERVTARDLWRKLITEPLSLCGEQLANQRRKIAIFIDGLDESGRNTGSSPNVSELVHLLTDCIAKLPVCFGVLVTSRREELTVRYLSRYKPMEMHCDDSASQRDVASFIRHVLSNSPASLCGDMLDQAVQILQGKSQGLFLAARLMMSSRGLIGSEPSEPVLSQLAEQGLTQSRLDARAHSPAALTLEAMRSWPTGLEAFYLQTMTESRFVASAPPSSTLTGSDPSYLGMQLIGAILVAPQPLSLGCLGEMVGVPWLGVLSILSPVRLLFPLEHNEREVYLQSLGEVDLDEHEHVLGSKQHSQSSMSCALSTVSVYHKSVYDWFFAPAKLSKFHVDSKRAHEWLANRCWDAIVLKDSLPAAGLIAQLRMTIFRAKQALWLHANKLILTNGFLLVQDFSDVRQHFISDASSKFASQHRDLHDFHRFMQFFQVRLAHDPDLVYQHALTFPSSTVFDAAKSLLPWLCTWPHRSTTIGLALWRNRPVDLQLSLLLCRFNGHTQRVTSVAFSPDGSSIASASRDQTICIWDVASSSLVTRFEGHTARVTSVVFSPDGSRIVSGSKDKTVKIWDAVSEELISTLIGHSGNVTSVAFSPDATRVMSGSWDGTLKLWDADSGSLIASFEASTEGVNSVAFSFDGLRIVSGNKDGTVRILELSGVPLVVLTGHSQPVNSVAFSPDGTRVVSGSKDGSIRIWDASSGSQLSLFNIKIAVNSVAFISRDGSLVVSGDNSGSVQLWCTAAAFPLAAFAGHVISVTSVAFSPHTRCVVSGGSEGAVLLWDVSSYLSMKQDVLLVNAPSGILSRSSGHLRSVGSVVFSPDGTRLASCSHDETVRMWDAVSGSQMNVFKHDLLFLQRVVFDLSGTRLFSSSNYIQRGGFILILDCASGSQLALFRTQSCGSLLSVAPDGTRLASSTSGDTALQIMDCVSGDIVCELRGEGDERLHTLAYSPDGTRIAIGSSHCSVRVLDAVSGTLIATLNSETSRVISVLFSPDSTRILSCSLDGYVRVWDAYSGSPISVSKGFDIWGPIAFSSDWTMLVSVGRDHIIRLWHLSTRTLIAHFEGHTDLVRLVAFSPDGSRIVSAGNDRTICVWNIRALLDSAAADARLANRAPFRFQLRTDFAVPPPGLVLIDCDPLLHLGAPSQLKTTIATPCLSPVDKRPADRTCCML